MNHRELQVGRQVVDRRKPVGLELEGPLPIDAVQAAHVMIGRLGPATRDERAVMRRGTVLADGYVRERSREHRPLRRELVRHADERPLHQRRHVFADEQVGQVGVAALRVEMHDLGALHREACPPQHVHLDGRVGKVLRLAAVGRLDLDHAVAPGGALQDVDPHVGVVRQKPGLVNRRHVVLQGLAGRGYHVVVLIKRQIDQLPARHVLASAHAHLASLGEQVLLPRRRRQLRGVGVVHPPPQLLVTLQARQIARLGKPRRRGDGRHD